MWRMILKDFCDAEGIELRRAMVRLHDEGLAVRGTMTIRGIADTAGVHPRELRDIPGEE